MVACKWLDPFFFFFKMSRRIRALFSLGLRSVATEYRWLRTQCPVIWEHFCAAGPVPSWTLKVLPAAVSPGSSLISTTLSSGFWWPWPPQTLGSVSSTRVFAGSHLVPSVCARTREFPPGSELGGHSSRLIYFSSRWDHALPDVQCLENPCLVSIFII